jgi:hypothetical protein
MDTPSAHRGSTGLALWRIRFNVKAGLDGDAIANVA